MVVDTLNSKTESELRSSLLDLSKELFNLRFQAVSGELENTSRVRKVRRDIARTKTSLNKLKLASSVSTKDKKEA